MKLDRFSAGFAKYAFKVHPEWESSSTFKESSYSDEGYLRIIIKNEEIKGRDIEILTGGEEVTVNFTFDHIHETSFRKAIEFVHEIMEERRIVMAVETHEEKYGTSLRLDEPLPDLNDIKGMKVRSWKGKYDKDIGEIVVFQ